MGVPKASFTFAGPARQSRTKGISGHQSVRNFCGDCGSQLFGTPESHPGLVTIYVGTLDDPTAFQPREALFTGQRPVWAKLAAALVEHVELPGTA